MSTALIWQTVSTASESTVQIAVAIGQRLKGGELFVLASDLGGGKTTFVRGLAQGMGSQDKVMSPSFTITREYRAPQRTLYHFDFYRLDDPGIMANELAELLIDQQAVVAVEWSEIVKNVLPVDYIRVEIQAQATNQRRITITVPPKLAYLLEGLD